MATNLTPKETPSIEYDKDLLVPEVIERKKWNLIYITLAALGVVLSIFFSYAVKEVDKKKNELTAQIVTYCNTKPKIDKLKAATTDVNVQNILISQFMLENLFFTDAKTYEIVNSIRSFFISEQVKSLVGSFEIKTILISDDKNPLNNIQKIPIKIDGKFTAYTDLVNMVGILKKMTPLIIIEDIDFSKGNTVSFKGYLYNFNKGLFVYEYGSKYKEVNDILKLKEEYQKNQEILKQLLKDKDLGLEKMGVQEIYDCKQYEDILKINKLETLKKKEIQMCKDITELVDKNQTELDKKFTAFIKNTNAGTQNFIPPSIDYTEAELGISCKDYGALPIKGYDESTASKIDGTSTGTTKTAEDQSVEALSAQQSKNNTTTPLK